MITKYFAACNSVAKQFPITVDIEAFGVVLRNAIDVISKAYEEHVFVSPFNISAIFVQARSVRVE